MIQKTKWSYQIQKVYLQQFFDLVSPVNILTTKSSVALKICKTLNDLVKQDGVFTADNLISNIFSLMKDLPAPKGKELVLFNVPGGILSNFHSNPNKSLIFVETKYKEALIKTMVLSQKKYKIKAPILSYDDGVSVQGNVQRLAKEYKLLPLEVYALLYVQNDLICEGNSVVRNKKVVSIPASQMSLFDNDSLVGSIVPESVSPLKRQTTSVSVVKEAEKENCEDELTILRNEIGKIFNHSSKEHNLYLINDGTGSGKTHNVVINFLKNYANKEFLAVKAFNPRKSLVFIAPQKNQLFANFDVFETAKNSNIPLLFTRSIEDLTNLDSKNFLIFEDNRKIFLTVRNYFDELVGSLSPTDRKEIFAETKNLYIKRFQILKSKSSKKANLDDSENDENVLDLDEDLPFEQEGMDLKCPSVDAFIAIYKTYSNYEDSNKFQKDFDLESYLEEYERVKIAFREYLQLMARFLAVNISDDVLKKVFVNGSVYKGFKNYEQIFGKKLARFYEFVYKILIYVLPFEVAKFVNSVIYLTGDKTKTLLPISEESVKYPELKVLKMYDLEDMVSGYSISKEANVLQAYKNPSESFGDFLDSEYFVKNQKSYFIQNNLGFSIVEDEEHILYNNFLNRYTFKNITNSKGSNLNFMHSLAGIKRWIENSNVTHRNVLNFSELDAEKGKIVRNLKKNLLRFTSFQTENEIDNFFNMISSNEFGIFAKTSDFDFINSVCENITSFSPKLIVLQEYLKSIKLVLNKGADSLLIAKDLKDCKESSVHYTVYDFFQILLTLLYVCKDATKPFIRMFYKERANDNQNMALYKLLTLASDNKEFLQSLFTSSLELKETDPVNMQFSYFMTKIGFNFEFPTVIENKEFNENYLRINPQIHIIKELPEVGILQMLNNPENKVFLLSATRGFNNIYSGNYSNAFFSDIDRFCPGRIKICKRELLVNNPMVNFIEKRFEKRKSIEVNKIEFQNSQITGGKDSVSILSYPVTTIALSSLNNSNDIKSIKKDYELIKNNGNGSKNYMKSVISSAKKTKEFTDLWNPYHKAELLGVLNSIVHSFENNEHSIVMTLSNRFRDSLQSDLFMGSVFKGAVRNLEMDKNRGKIFEWNPLLGSENDNKKLRVVFFDSEMGKIPNLDDYLKIDEDTVVVLVSSFGSAGTGLNLTLSEKNKTELDFSSIYFVSSPYYTSVLGDSGYASMSNQLLIYKAFAHMKNKTIQDLSEGLSSKDIKEILFREHIMEKVKSLMQSSGRIERRDIEMDTKIYFVENGISSLFDSCMAEFNQMFKSHENGYQKSIISNFSMLNKALTKVAINHVRAQSLTVAQRNLLETKTREQYDVYNRFFTNVNGQLMKEYRAANPDYAWFADFNAILRGYKSADYNFKEKLKEFIKTNEDLLKKVNVYSDMKNLYLNAEFDLEANGIPKNSKITADFFNYRYSDYSHSFKTITDDFFFDYGGDLYAKDLNKQDLFLREIFSKQKKSNTLTRLPNFYLSHIIRGNIAEGVLEDYFKEIGRKYNNFGELFNNLVEMKLYELFDFYFIEGKTIYAVDTKNWNNYNDSGAIKTLSRFEDKVSIIKGIPEFKGYNFKFIYLNMFPYLNDAFTNGLSTHFSSFKDVEYMNFIIRKPEFVKKKNEKKHIQHIKVNELLTINEQWRNI